MSAINMNIKCFLIILVSTSLFSVATAEDGYISETNAATASPEKSLAGGTNKTIDSNISTDLHLCASTLISIVLIICVTILLIKLGHGIIFLLCFYMMIKSDDKKIINIHNETYNVKTKGKINQVAAKMSKTADTVEGNSLNEQQPKRKPKMSKSSSAKKETEELLQESHAIQLLSQIYEMTQSLLHDTQEIIKKFDQNEETSKNSTESISTELAELQKEKESQSLFPDNLSHAEAPGFLEGTPACINHRNSHGSHSTNTLDSKAGEQIKDAVDVPKEVAPFLKNNSLRRITYDFNEIQSPTELSEKPLKDASNTNSDSNISTSTVPYTFLITLALNFFLILHGYGVNLFLYFPFINKYSRISSHQKISNIKNSQNFICNSYNNNSKLKAENISAKNEAIQLKDDGTTTAVEPEIMLPQPQSKEMKKEETKSTEYRSCK